VEGGVDKGNGEGRMGRRCGTGAVGGPAVAGGRREGPRRPGRRGGKRAQHVSIATASHLGRACGARRPPIGMRQHRAEREAPDRAPRSARP